MTEQEIREEYPDACNTEEVQEQYTVKSFMAPYICCVRKRDNMLGSMMFQHDPRMYFGFQPDQAR